MGCTQSMVIASDATTGYARVRHDPIVCMTIRVVSSPPIGVTLIDYTMTRYCRVCDAFRQARVMVSDSRCVDIVCIECNTQSVVPRFA